MKKFLIVFLKIIDEGYLDWIGDSQVPEKFLLNNYIKNKQDIPILLFEDFNTTGIKGDWDITNLSYQMEKEMIIIYFLVFRKSC